MKAVLSALLLWMMLATGALTAFESSAAGDDSPVPPQAAAGRSTVRLDGRALFQVSESGGTDARTRGRQIEQRLIAALDSAEVGRLPAVRVLAEPQNPRVRVLALSGRSLVTVTTADAEAHGVTIDELAARWAGVVDSAVRQAAQRRNSAVDRLVTAVQGSLRSAFARLLESALQVVPRALAALLVIGLFWLLAAAVRRLLRLISDRFIADRTVANLIKQLGYYTVWLIGLIVAANAFGLEPQTVVTGLGLTSLALGFALKDILSNFVSGLLILTLRPFELGDQIVIGETEGTVERIELRATIVRTYDGRAVSVPNAETFTSRVTNNTASPVRRASITVRLGYDVDFRAAEAALVAAAASTDAVLKEPPASVRLQALDADDMLAELRFWTDSRRSDFVATQSEVRNAVIDHLQRDGIRLTPEHAVRIVNPGSMRLEP